MLRATRDPLRRIVVLWRDEVAALITSQHRLALLGRIVGIWVVEAVALLAVAWVLPDVLVQGPLAALALVVLVQVLFAAVRPIVVYLLLPLLVLSGGLLGLVVNAALLLLADAIIPWTRIGGVLDALVVVIVLSGANFLVAVLVDLDRASGFYRSLARRLVRRGRPELRHDRPGVVFVQVDGLGHDVLAEAVRTGRMPTVARWLRDGTHELHRWECALPSQTSASQAGLLLGDNTGIPAFRWYEKDTGRLLVSNRPADAAEIERRLSTGHGLLSRNGSSVGNLLSGDASRSVLTMSTLTDLRAGIRRRSRDFFLFFVDPYTSSRITLGMLFEIGRELWQARRQARRGVWPRIDRRGEFPFLRAASCVLLQDLAVALLVEDMSRGVAATYVDLVGYDEVAHHAGPERPEALATLEQVDRALAEVEAANASSARPYRTVVLSDHGQSQGATFRQRNGATLEALLHGLMRGEATVAAATRSVEGWGPLNAFLSELVSGHGVVGAIARLGLRAGPSGLVELGPSGGELPLGSSGGEVPLGPPAADDASAARPGGVRATGTGEPIVGPAPARPRDVRDRRGATPTEPADLVVCASGNLANVYFPRVPGRATRESLEAAHPGLIDTLVRTPWIGFAMVATEARGAAVVGPSGVRWLRDDTVEGDDPLTGFGPLAAAHLRRLDTFAAVGDLVVNSAVDAVTGEVAAFEELVGSHGGLGGPQTRPFLLRPVELPAPTAELVGAPAVGALLRAWVLEQEEAAGAPQTAVPAAG